MYRESWFQSTESSVFWPVSPSKTENNPFWTETEIAVGTANVPAAVQSVFPAEAASYSENLIEYVPSATGKPDESMRRAWYETNGATVAAAKAWVAPETNNPTTNTNTPNNFWALQNKERVAIFMPINGIPIEQDPDLILPLLFLLHLLSSSTVVFPNFHKIPLFYCAASLVDKLWTIKNGCRGAIYRALPRTTR
jgi:hypothetical protein